MADRVQTYKNHARLLPPFHFFVLPVLLIHFVIQVRGLWAVPSGSSAWAVVVALALVIFALYARVMALTVQDRVIRLEMRQRLLEVLPADLKARINELSPRHLVALRFAGDGELAVLVRDVLEGRLTNPKDIKLRVKDWQADWLRA
jgi:hypothetical protein